MTARRLLDGDLGIDWALLDFRAKEDPIPAVLKAAISKPLSLIQTAASGLVAVSPLVADLLSTPVADDNPLFEAFAFH